MRLRHPFEKRLLDIKKRLKPEPFNWYPFDSIANITQIEALIPNGLASVLNLACDEPVADIGAGDGDMAFLLESLGCDVTAIDWPGTNANEMKGLAVMARELRSSVAIRKIDLDDQFLLDGERFGLVLSLGLLYHLKNPYYFLEKLSIHARHCLLSTRILPPARTREPVAYLSKYREFQDDVTNFWFFSESGILRLLDRCGWDVQSTRITGDGEDVRFFCLAESRGAKTKPIIRLLNGWYRMEKRAWRWTGREFGAVIENMAGSTRFDWRFRLLPDLLKSGNALTVEATVNGQPLAPETFRNPGDHLYSRTISPAPRRCEVGIRLSNTFSDGERDLGVVVRLPCNTIIDEDCGLRLYS